ncbi:run and fyve domain-containing protein 2-like protein [Holotrichia oblita]|uniref:Run and fyve domain-containing protein 2-like protein n=1 Tax=Holotrichia oblita TaxID=644536 RepID=A0ACB9SSR8_HOLOL|nr:run and fyve domain-containing protein 2-like protein [Holotrichia oblita]
MKIKEMVETVGHVTMEQEMAGAQDTIYLCNFRVSVDGEWLCLKELHDVEFNMQDSAIHPLSTPSPDAPVQAFGRDPVVIERSNLVNISKLVVKELIEQSLRYGRMLDSDHMPLQHFFIVLEHVLRHGLRPKKGLLGPKKELWDILQMVEKYAPEAQDITASVRDLPTVRTHMGRARAWLRLALMQKKLADYLKVLIDHKDEALVEYFEPDALMLSDEAIIIIGLLVGLNVIDCNLCVKEEDLDCPQGVIDFSLYLRSSNQITETTADDQEDNMTMVLDQKNYIEELNRHLNATVTNLQAKVESLTTTNALMKEDLAIAKNSLLSLYEENRLLKCELGKEDGSDKLNEGVRITNYTDGDLENGKSAAAEIAELRQRLEEERKLRQEADKELQLQPSVKIRGGILNSTRTYEAKSFVPTATSLTDNIMNDTWYIITKECEMELTQKGEMVSRLQAKAGQIGKILNNLEKYNHLLRDEKKNDRKSTASSVKRSESRESAIARFEAMAAGSEGKASSNSATEYKKAPIKTTIAENQTKQDINDTSQTHFARYRECESVRLLAERRRRELDLQAAHQEEQTNGIEEDLKVEREWRVSLQETMQQDREKISQLQHELTQLRLIAQKYASLQEEYYTLKEHCLEQDQTLEELGKKLSDSKLELSELKEQTSRKNDGTWANDKDATQCRLCEKEFNLTRRKHHCRNCGDIFCNACSDNSMSLPSSAKPVRVCDNCQLDLSKRQTVM